MPSNLHLTRKSRRRGGAIVAVETFFSALLAILEAWAPAVGLPAIA